MSIESDIVTLLDPLVSGGVHAVYLPSDATLPYVVFRVLSRDRESLLSGADAMRNSLIAFHCFGTTYPAAVALADSVSAALESSSLVCYPDNQAEVEIDFDIEAYVETVYFGFWHN